jgi:hypothetical protein
MGTRSLTYFFDTHSEAEPLLCVYRQYDGYISGHGLELGHFLSKFKIVNGLGHNDDEDIKIANGMGCLSAQFIASFKREAGNIYISAPILNKDCGQEYEYHVFKDHIEAYSMYNEHGKYKDQLFSGTWLDFLEYCQITKAREEYQSKQVA